MRENRTTIQMQQDKPGALFFSKMAHPHTWIAKLLHISLMQYLFGLDEVDQ
jgi:hypothetical protein